MVGFITMNKLGWEKYLILQAHGLLWTLSFGYYTWIIRTKYMARVGLLILEIQLLSIREGGAGGSTCYAFSYGGYCHRQFFNYNHACLRCEGSHSLVNCPHQNTGWVTEFQRPQFHNTQNIRQGNSQFNLNRFSRQITPGHVNNNRHSVSLRPRFTSRVIGGIAYLGALIIKIKRFLFRTDNSALVSKINKKNLKVKTRYATDTTISFSCYAKQCST